MVEVVWAFIPLFLVVVFSMIHMSYTAFTPIDNYLLACGSSQNVFAQGQVYVPDSKRGSVVLENSENSVIASSNSSVPLPIFKSVRIFSSRVSYKFRIRRRGRHWVRLYFYPLPNSGYNLRSAPITVATDNFVLLNNFTFKGYNGSYLFKEYLINVTMHTLSLTFIPSYSSVTFVNVIEVVSVPDALISDQALPLSSSEAFSGSSLFDSAFETVYRFNMGGPIIVPENDTLGRTWHNDEKYLHIKNSAVDRIVDPSIIKYQTGVTSEIAPNWVYASAETMGDPNVANLSFNMTWVLPVDPNFMYFVRVHLCDIVSRSSNVLVFNIYINSKIAYSSLDLSSITGSLASAYYKDFVSNSRSDSDTLTVSVGPDDMADMTNAIMNGLEIMKISNPARSLDGQSSVEGILRKSPSKKSKVSVIVASVIGTLAAVAFVALCYYCFIACMSKDHHQRHAWLSPLYGNSPAMTNLSKSSQKSGTTSLISLASSSFGRVFMFQEIMDATNKFDKTLLIGVGGFGWVYKGTLEDGTEVAVKRGKPERGLSEFRTEIEMLSKLRHRHLVSLIGYCDEHSEMILVYDYMAYGPLQCHLYGTDLPSLTWKQRLEICIGAGRGLHYLHTGATQNIIHRDVKTTNILLDENFVAKVADFGISKTGPSLDQTHVSTAVKGSFGYLDPEYFRRQQLTEKSDVYSFGVVLMEVLCARPALDPLLPKEQVNIAEWAMTCQKKGLLDQIMDVKLVGNVNPASLKKFGETAENCLAQCGVDRPTMGDVLWNLEYALQLEETSSALNEPDENSTNHIAGIPLTPLEPYDHSVNMIDEVTSGTDDDGEDAATRPVLSQLVNLLGR